MKRFKSFYKLLKFVAGAFLFGISFFVDSRLVLAENYKWLWLFLPLELALTVYTVLMFLYFDKIVISAECKNGRVKIETLGNRYKAPLAKIKVIKGRLNYYIMKFDNTKLRVYPSNKQVNEFIKQYFKRL